MSCGQEMCPLWTGQGCICEVTGYWEPPEDEESEVDFAARVDAINEEYPL